VHPGEVGTGLRFVLAAEDPSLDALSSRVAALEEGHRSPAAHPAPAPHPAPAHEEKKEEEHR